MRTEVNPEKLVDIDDETICHWREVIAEASLNQRVILLSDTETTGLYKVTQDNLFNRVVEWSFLVCVEREDGTLCVLRDQRGNPIQLDQPIDFLAISPSSPKLLKSTLSIEKGSADTHGITEDYLGGGEGGLLGRPPLPHQAPHFKAVFDVAKMMFSGMAYHTPATTPVLMFYNAPFDVGFLNLECELWRVPPIESYFCILDLMTLAKRYCTSVQNKTLDSVYQWSTEILPVDDKILRPYHSAIVDSEMMLNVYNAIIHVRKSG